MSFSPRRLLALVGSSYALLILGCSGGSGAPTLPNNPAALPGPQTPTTPLNIAGNGDEIPLGSTHLRIDATGAQIMAEPVRINQAIGDAYIVGLNELDALCDCFRVTAMSATPTATGALVAVDVEFDHPFALTLRPDLFGWDLKAIIASDVTPANFPSKGITAPGNLLVNPSGYTEEWSPQISGQLPSLNANTFPYVILGEDPTPTDPFDFTNPSGWNVFPAGGTNSGTLTFNVPTGETIDVHVFFTVGYQASATRATRQSPDYQVPRGNSRAPWKVAATVANSDLTTQIGTSAAIDLEIWDWQHGASLQSDITGINVLAPALTTIPPTPAIGSESGRGTDPVTSSFTITNDLGTAPAGIAYVLVEVLDSLHQSNPGGQVGQPGTAVVGDDFTTISDLDNVRTFQIIPLEVGANLPGADPTACATAVPPIVANELTTSINQPVLFDASCSTDPDPGASPEGMIVGYEWDFEWDGVIANFVDDTAGAGTVNEMHTYTTLGFTKMGLRVEDGVGRKSPILTVDVEVVNQILTLVLEATEDISVPGRETTEREYGATLVEESDGPIALNFTSEFHEPNPPNPYRSAYEVYSQWNGSTWSSANGFFGSSGGAGTLVYGWNMKTAANAIGTTVGTHTFRWATDYTVGHPIVFTYLAPGSNYNITGYHSYNVDIACTRSSGTIFGFNDQNGTLKSAMGGPNLPDQPTFFWYNDGVPTTTIDTGCYVSRARSATTDAANNVHLAYQTTTKSELRYAKDAGADNTWTTATLATGGPDSYQDPALCTDEGGNVYIAVTHFNGTDYQIQLYTSTDAGATWGSPVNVGASMATEPFDLSVSANNNILGLTIVSVAYNTADYPTLGESRVRWTANSGASWTDVLLSAGGNDSYDPQIYIRRNANEFYSVWSATVGGREQVQVRRGSWQYI